MSETLGTEMNNEMKRHVQFITVSHSTADNIHTYIFFKLKQNIKCAQLPTSKGQLKTCFGKLTSKHPDLSL